MASKRSLQDLAGEATCSICLDYFQDSVLIPECGHNFCRGCLTCGWGTSKSEAFCPQCRQIFGIRSLLPNRQLVEVARRCGGYPGEEGGSFCPRHLEPLKLFCKDHQTLICVVCDRSKEHSCHRVIPAEEAFQEYQDIGSILKKYQAKETYENPVDLPKWTIWDYSDIPGLLKSAMKKLRDTLESGLQLQEENVILDPDTAHPDRLDISEDRRSVKGLKSVKKRNAVPNGKRFEYNPYVLGCQMFSSGQHFWEVVVGDREGWGVGVANKPLNLTDVDEQTRHWLIGEWGGKYMAISLKGGKKESSDLVLTERPKRIRISLNCEEGQLVFFDARTAALLHTFSDTSLVGETLLPCFYLPVGVYVTLPSKKGHP